MPKNEKPILFSAPMVRAILSGQKTQTRRVIKPQPTVDADYEWIHWKDLHCSAYWSLSVNAPYQPGDRLWVRETTIIAPPNFATPDETCIPDNDGYLRYIQYLATHPNTDAAEDYGLKKTPSIFMPKWVAGYCNGGR